MRQQLIQYVDLLFAGAPGTEEIRQEILQNTLDRYDDLIAQGKSAEAAYRLAISGIGDINEILGAPAQEQPPAQEFQNILRKETDHIQSRKMRAVAIAMYILSPTPLFILSEVGNDTIGLCLTLALIAAATYLMYMSRQPGKETERDADSNLQPGNTELIRAGRKAGKLIWAIGLIVYLILSLATQAWFTTWLIFPILGCMEGLINAILDLKEDSNEEI